MSGRASSGPPLSATDNRLGRDGGGSGGGREKGSVCVCGRGHRWLLFSIYSCPPLLVSSLPCPRGRERREFFPPAVPLSGDNHLLFGVPRRQSGLASTWEVQKQDQQHLHGQHAPISDADFRLQLTFVFPKHSNEISALAEIKSIHYNCAWVGIEVSWSRACCISAKTCLRIHYFTQSEQPRL